MLVVLGTIPKFLECWRARLPVDPLPRGLPLLKREPCALRPGAPLPLPRTLGSTGQKALWSHSGTKPEGSLSPSSPGRGGGRPKLAAAAQRPAYPVELPRSRVGFDSSASASRDPAAKWPCNSDSEADVIVFQFQLQKATTLKSTYQPLSVSKRVFVFVAVSKSPPKRSTFPKLRRQVKSHKLKVEVLLI